MTPTSTHLPKEHGMDLDLGIPTFYNGKILPRPVVPGIVNWSTLLLRIKKLRRRSGLKQKENLGPPGQNQNRDISS
jgi:hypothetical protein